MNSDLLVSSGRSLLYETRPTPAIGSARCRVGRGLFGTAAYSRELYMKPHSFRTESALEKGAGARKLALLR